MRTQKCYNLCQVVAFNASRFDIQKAAVDFFLEKGLTKQFSESNLSKIFKKLQN